MHLYICIYHVYKITYVRLIALYPYQTGHRSNLTPVSSKPRRGGHTNIYAVKSSEAMIMSCYHENKKANTMILYFQYLSMVSE